MSPFSSPDRLATRLKRRLVTLLIQISLTLALVLVLLVCRLDLAKLSMIKGSSTPLIDLTKNGPPVNLLRSVAAWSPTDVWAVGQASLKQDPPSNPYLKGTKTLIERWNSRQWSVVPSPSPGLYSLLMAVTVLSASDAWAVGSTWDDQTKTMRTLIEHWDGRSWQRIPSPNDADLYWDSELAAVTAHSPGDVWAVGYASLEERARPLIEHWDGHTWQLVPSPFPRQAAGSELSGVVALSASDAWAVGSSDSYPLVEHWDGHRWTLEASAPLPGITPSGTFWALGAASSENIWAVGERQSNGEADPLIEHWDGQAVDSGCRRAWGECGWHLDGARRPRVQRYLGGGWGYPSQWTRGPLGWEDLARGQDGARAIEPATPRCRPGQVHGDHGPLCSRWLDSRHDLFL